MNGGLSTNSWIDVSEIWYQLTLCEELFHPYSLIFNTCLMHPFNFNDISLIELCMFTVYCLPKGWKLLYFGIWGLGKYGNRFNPFLVQNRVILSVIFPFHVVGKPPTLTKMYVIKSTIGEEIFLLDVYWFHSKTS